MDIRLYFYIYEMRGLGLPIPKDCASFSYIKISLRKAKVKTKKINKLWPEVRLLTQY